MFSGVSRGGGWGGAGPMKPGEKIKIMKKKKDFWGRGFNSGILILKYYKIDINVQPFEIE